MERVIRSVLCSLATGLILSMILWMDARLVVEFGISAAQDGERTELFYGLGQDGFHSSRSRRWQPPGEVIQSYQWRYSGFKRVNRVRIDPVSTTGKGSIGSVSFAGHGGRVTLAGSALSAWIERTNDLEILSIDEGVIVWLAVDSDPQIIMAVPPGVYALVLPLPWIAVMALISGLLWFALESLFGRRRARQVMGSLLLVGLITGLTWLSQLQIVNAPFTGDAVQNVRIAENLVDHGTYSHLEERPPRPTNQREPLPTFVLAGWILMLEAVDPMLRQSEDYPAALRHINLLWIFAGLLAVAMLARTLTGSDLAAVAAALAVFLFFHGRPQVVNALYTELPAAALMTWLSLAAWNAARRQALTWLLLVGVLLGLLALTKNAMYYVALVAIPLFAGLSSVAVRRYNDPSTWLRSAGLRLLTLALGFMVVTAPWMVRNLVTLDTAEISGRAGVLFGRALMNDMSLDEALGSLYIHGPQLYHRLVAGTRLAPGPDDLMAGGRWQRLNRGASDFLQADIAAAAAGRPEDAISFHRVAIAEYVRQRERLRDQGVENVEVELERWFRSEGLRLIAERPIRHVVMSLPAAWRGFWGFPYGELPLLNPYRSTLVVDLVNLAGGMALGIAVLLGLFGRRPEWVVLTLVPIGMLAFYALLTHNIARYMMPVIPLMLVLLVAIPWCLRSWCLVGNRRIKWAEQASNRSLLTPCVSRVVPSTS